MDVPHFQTRRKVLYLLILEVLTIIIISILLLILQAPNWAWVQLGFALIISSLCIEIYKRKIKKEIQKNNSVLLMVAVKSEHVRQLRVLSATLNWSHAESSAAIIEMIEDEISEFHSVPKEYLEVLQDRAASIREKAPDIRSVDFASHSIKLPGHIPFAKE